MKKRKSIFAICLIAVLCLSLLAGCGGKSGGGDDSGGSTASPGGSGANPSAAPAQDAYVYTAEYIPVKESLGGFGGGSLTYCDGKLLTSTYGVVGNNTPEGVTPEYEGQYDVYGTIFYWLGLDGTVQKLDKYEPVQYETEVEDATVTSFSMGFDVGPDGVLRILEEVFVSWYDGPEDEDVEMYSDEWYSKGYYAYQHNEEHFYLRTLGKDGEELSCVDLSALEEDSGAGGGMMGGFGMSSFTADAAGNIYMSTGSSIVILDPNGGKKGEVSISGGGFAWISNLLRLRDGRVAASFNSGGSDRLNVIDLDTMSFSKTDSWPVVNATNMSVGSENSEYDFYYTNGSNFMGYSLEKGESEKVLNWINADVDPSGVGAAVLLPDGRIAALETTWASDFSSSTTELVLLSRVPASSVAQKTVLTLATQSLNYNIRSQIVKFNRSSPDFRIEVADYSEYNTENDSTAGLTKLNTEILAGNVPDILDLNGLSAGQLGSRGILADLYPFLNADPELSGRIFPNVLKALESDGKLYRTASNFNLYVVMGAASVVGDTPGWTLADFNKALKTMPEGCEPFSASTTRSSILNACLNMEMNSLVDWNTGECHFDSQTFTDILEFAAIFPASVDNGGGFGWGFGGGGESEEDRVAQGKQMLMQTWMYNFDSFQMYNAMFGGNATFIGFPTSQGVGNAIMFQDSGYAISSKCANKDAAWQFLRVLFGKDYQASSFMGFPTNMDAFEDSLAEAMTPEYEKDANGNYVLDENGEKIELPRSSWGWGSSATELYALSQTEADEIRKLVMGTDRVWGADQGILDTITSESEAFFAGQKSAQEVAKLIQSKLTIYVNEQR